MKKIISALLILVLALGVLTSCNGNLAGIDEFDACFASSAPDKIVIVSTQAFDNMALENSTTITKGKINGMDAAVMTVKGEKMRSVEDGSGEFVLGPIEELDVTKWYRSDMGVSEDKGKTWDAEAPSFAPEKGDIALNLDPSLLENGVIDGNKLTFSVKPENNAKVFGDLADVGVDVNVEIVTDGAVVTNVRISWVLPFNGASGVEMTTVTINATYYYDIQQLDM